MKFPLHNTLIFYCPFLALVIEGHNHWFVTDNGKIHAKPHSLMNMADTQDLVQFIRQNDIVLELESIRKIILQDEILIEQYEKLDDPQLEEKIMKGDKDCINVAKTLANLDLHIHVPIDHFNAWSFLNHFERIDFNNDQTYVQSGRKAFCDTKHRMRSFDHLEGVVHRKHLKMKFDSSVEPLQLSNVSNSMLSQLITQSFDSQGAQHWSLFTLLAYYWLRIGNIAFTVDCLLSAVDISPRPYFHIPASALAAIMHYTGHSKDAAVILRTAISYSPSLPYLYFAVALAYTVSHELNKAQEALGRCLKLKPDFPLAKQYKHAIACHQKVHDALELQHKNLQQTLIKLQSYKENLKHLEQLQKLASLNIVDSAGKQVSDIFYEEIVHGPLPGVRCWKQWNLMNKQAHLECDIVDYEAYAEHKQALISNSSNFDVTFIKLHAPVAKTYRRSEKQN